MRTILEYCIQYNQRIIDYNQDQFKWDKYRVAPIIDIIDFGRCISQIPNQISRSEILDAFRNRDYYKGFIMSMLWGGIGLRPKIRNDKTTTSAYKAFTIPADEVNRRLNIINEKIQNDDIQNAYRLLKTELKFKGIDVSFFTKLLSFLSEANTPIRNLLIYDKWTKLIHVHLLLDNGSDPCRYYSRNNLLNLYSRNKKNNKPLTELIYPKKSEEIYTYLNYIDSMVDLSNSIMQNSGIRITPFQLETFLFGKELKSNNLNFDNPRYWIQQNFANRYLPHI